MIEIFYLVVFVLLSYAFGRRVLSFFGFDFSSFLEGFVLKVSKEEKQEKESSCEPLSPSGQALLYRRRQRAAGKRR